MSHSKYFRAFYRNTEVYQDDVITLTAAEELDVENSAKTNSISDMTTTAKTTLHLNKTTIHKYYFITRKLLIIIAAIFVIILIIFTGLHFYKVKTEYNQKLKHRRAFIRSMARSAWSAYKQYAWNHGALKPFAKRPMPEVDHDQKPGYTILAAMTTLKVMGLEKEFSEGRDWILNNSFENRLATTKQYLIVDWPINAYIGSLMSLYALTGETVYREKAVAVEKILEPAFDNQTGFLHLELHPANKVAKTKIYNDEEDENGEGSAGNNFLFFIGHQSPAFLYLADATNNSRLKTRLRKIFTTIKTVEKPNGLYFEAINVKTGNWSRTEVVDAEHGVFFFNDLVQSYIMQSESGNPNNKEALRIFCDAIQAMIDIGMFQDILMHKNENDAFDTAKGLSITKKI